MKPHMKPHSRRKFLQTSCAALTGPSLSALGQTAAPEKRLLGVTVFPEYIQSEGIDGVLDNLRQQEIVDAIRTGPLEKGVETIRTTCRKRMLGEHGGPSKPDDATLVVFRP